MHARAAGGSGAPEPEGRFDEIPILTEPMGRSRDVEFADYFTGVNRRDLERTAWLLAAGDVHRAEELVQTALVRTYTAWARASATNPLAYARRVMTNARIDSWRRTKRELTTSPDRIPSIGSVDPSSSVDDRDQIVRALALLRPRLRKILVLRYILGLTEREVADELGMTIGTVKSQSSRGLARLRTIIESQTL